MPAAPQNALTMSLILKNILLPLAAFNLEVNAEIQGRVTAIFGPSGAGKTSLLELVAGLRSPKSAFIELNGRVLTDVSQGLFVPTRHRGVGYVPQDMALFPHLTVRQNLCYGQKSGGDKAPLFTFDRIVEVLEIKSLTQRGVTELSGGEKQRVALARALLASPVLLLLDEPLASLDRKLKARIIPYLARIRDEFGVAMLYVTHDRFETLALADEMIVLIDGKVAQTGPVREVFSRPANLQVASLFTVETILPGRVVKNENDLLTVAVGSSLLSAVPQALPANSSAVHVCIRAEDVVVARDCDSPNSARNHLPAIIESLAREGPLVRVELNCGFNLSALVTNQSCEEMNLKSGDNVTAVIKAPHVHLIPR